MADFCESCGIFLVSDKERKNKLCDFCFTRQPKLLTDRRGVKRELERWLLQLRNKRHPGTRKWK